jgi:hypothetical protein
MINVLYSYRPTDNPSNMMCGCPVRKEEEGKQKTNRKNMNINFILKLNFKF